MVPRLLILALLLAVLVQAVLATSSDEEFQKAERKMAAVSRKIDAILSSKLQQLRKNKQERQQQAKDHLHAETNYQRVRGLEKRFESQAVKEANLAKLDARRAMRAASGLASIPPLPTPVKKSPPPINSAATAAGVNPKPRGYWRDRSEVNGLWKAGEEDAGPPFIPKVLMYTGQGVNRGMVDIVRKFFNFKLSWRSQGYHGQEYLNSFEGNHFRFISRSSKSQLIIPPLSSPLPEFTDISGKEFKQFIDDGGDLIVCGGPHNILFLNDVLPLLGYSGNLEMKWSPGPFEKQKPALHSRFQLSAIMLPGEDAWGVVASSLPPEAASYYEAPDVSVVFAIKTKKGQIVYVGSTFGGQFPQWRDVLIDAAQARN